VIQVMRGTWGTPYVLVTGKRTLIAEYLREHFNIEYSHKEMEWDEQGYLLVDPKDRRIEVVNKFSDTIFRYRIHNTYTIIGIKDHVKALNLATRKIAAYWGHR